MSEDEICNELVGAGSPNNTDDAASIPITKKTKRKNYVKKVEHDWSHDEIMQLIVAVEQRRLSWDLADGKLQI